MLPVTNLGRNKRSPGTLQELAPVPNRWSRWMLIPLMAALLAIVFLAWQIYRPAQSIDEVRLAGHRSPVPISLVVLLDESGSFEGYESIRAQTLRSVMNWSNANLRSDDSITVISFAGSAGTKMKTATVAEVTAGTATLDNPILDGGTSIQPALRLAQNSTPTNRAQSLIVVTDTVIDDAEQTAINEAIRDLNVTKMSLIIPENVPVASEWSAAFPYELVIGAPADSADRGALAIAQAVAHATGQTLEIER